MKKFLVSYFLFALFFFTFFSSGFVDSLDGFQYLAVTRRVYYDHTFELPKETLESGENIWMMGDKGNDGKIFSTTGLGYTLALLPAVAIEDVFLKLSKTSPISAFPLNSDWPVLLFASFTNAFFGALLVVIMYLYLRTFNISHKNSILLSFLSVVATNLFPYTKHTFAHMMFVSFLMASFYFIRRYSIKKSPLNILFAGISYGFVVISYNSSFTLTLLPLIIYYMLLIKPAVNVDNVKKIARDVLFGFIGVLPLYLLNWWFNDIRFGQVSTAGIGNNLSLPRLPSYYVIFEGIWNTIISPGRGLLIYSPLILIIFFFWFKLKKEIWPEIVSFGILTLMYIFLIGTLHSGEWMVWHGEYSWGPRYLLPVIPPLMILVANIYSRMALREKLFAFFPLAVIGISIQLLGVLLPYQIKFGGLQEATIINEHYLNQVEYANIIPRFSPVFRMPKLLVQRLSSLRDTYATNTSYDVHLYDGFKPVFDLGYTKWREVLPKSHITFTDSSKQKLDNIELQLRNHQIDKESSHSAVISLSINGQPLPKLETEIAPDKEKQINIPISANTLNKGKNNLTIETKFESTTSARLKDKQIVFLQFIKFNNIPAKIDTIDYPYVSPISQSLYQINYQTWGNTEKDPYEIWDIHSQVFERTLDLWWLRPFYYWDFPKSIFGILFIINLGGIVYFGYRTFKNPLLFK